ncbi:MAG: BCCT family transporter [Deltaproteobacteria bacterium]|nr:BCCT family transporter [Deltaproteobacteria bacterium]MBW2633269.1 BCCT family transporter [Deltaproteobacteria bacterium]MBW2676050.1 BCCT family transporter [Deltaproteobacteria bacterium]
MSNSNKPFDPFIFWTSASITILFVLWSIFFPENMSSTINAVFGWTTKNWGWLYLLTAFSLVIGCFVLMGGKYGKMKLGLPDDKPEFSNFSWFAMLFGSAIAAGIVFWGPAEPAYHYMNPPPYFGGEANTPQAGVDAMTYSFFHWGLSAWAIYAILTIAIGHACFTKNLPLKFSSAFYYVIGDRIHGTWGKILDVFAVFATLGGLATTTGLVALQLSSGLKYHYGMQLGPQSMYIIIGILTLVFTLAVYTGLEKGIKIIGDINMLVFIAVWFFVLVFGPTIFLINLTTNALGQYLIHFIPMSLFTAPGFEGNWIGAWTVFYWAWWMSWAPFVAVFIARISKGRTIRETIAATLILPTLGDFLWYGVVGGAGISYDVTATLKEHGVESAIFAIAQNLPLTGILAVVLIFLITTFFLTSANSAALSLAMFVSGHETPSKNLRAFWGIALGAVAAVLAGTGSLKIIQTASIATAFPLMFLLLLVLYGVFKGLNQYSSQENSNKIPGSVR